MLTKEKRDAIVTSIQMCTSKMAVVLDNYADNVSVKVIQMKEHCSDKLFIQNLHSIKIEFLNLGKEAFEHMEELKRIIESNPDEPELELRPATELEIKETTDTYYPPFALTNEDLQDDNPIEEDERG